MKLFRTSDITVVSCMTANHALFAFDLRYISQTLC